MSHVLVVCAAGLIALMLCLATFVGHGRRTVAIECIKAGGEWIERRGAYPGPEGCLRTLERAKPAQVMT
jgi:hypothetical protein